MRGTWRGRPGRSETRELGNGTGLRVVEHQWDDESTVSVRLITGEYANVVEYLTVDGVEPGQGAALHAALLSELMVAR